MLAFIGFLKGLLDALKLIREALSLYQKARQEGWLEEGRALVAKIKEAKTDAERKDLVRRWSDWSSG